jgi:hypothetical protein
MANASFYKPKFGTIDLMTNCWVGGHILTWWQSLSSYLNKTSLLTKIWIDSLHKSSGKLSQISNKTRISAFGLLELELWAEHWTVSGLQDGFRLLRCCYHLYSKMALLNLGLFMKVLGLCLSFLYI